MAGAAPKKRPPFALLGAGVLVIALGFGLPQMAPSLDAPAKLDAPLKSEPALKPTEVSQELRGTTTPPDLGALLGRMVVVLIVVCGACIGITRFLTPKAAQLPGNNMEVVATLAIDLRTTLHLVKAGNRRLLLGADSFGVKDIVELPFIDEPEVIGPVTIPTHEEPGPDQIAEYLLRHRTMFPGEKTRG